MQIFSVTLAERRQRFGHHSMMQAARIARRWAARELPGSLARAFYVSQARYYLSRASELRGGAR